MHSAFRPRTLLLAALLLAALFFSGCSTVPLHDREKQAFSFAMRKLVRLDGSVMTYPLDNDEVHQELGVTPKDVLAESLGLAMLYFVKIDHRYHFDRTWSFVRRRMLSDYGVVSWKFDAQKGEPLTSSATVDDLRIARALLEAHKRFEAPKYLEAALKLGQAIRRHDVVDGYPVEFFAWGGGSPSASSIVDLSYLDLYTMKWLALYDADWTPIYEKSRDLILNSLSRFGLFYDKYEPATDRYYNKHNNLINKLMCAIHLAETGVHESSVIAFIEREMFDTGTIKGRYDAESGEATVAFDSVAVYALALHFAVLYDQERLIDRLLERLEQFQKGRGEGVLSGCFGYGNCHAFDTFQVLLMYRRLPLEWQTS